MENKIICNCMQVSVANIEEALHTSEKFESVEKLKEQLREDTRRIREND